MSDPDFNLLVALDVLLAEASVAGTARRLNLSTSAMSRTLSRLREVTGDPILVRAGRQMVLTPWAEATRDRARSAVHEARAVLQPSTETLNVERMERLFTIRANDGFVVAFGPLLIAAVAAVAPDVCIRFSPKPEKTSRYLREGLVDLEIGVQSNMGPEIRLQRLFQDRFVGAVRQGHPLASLSSVSLEDYVAWGHVVASPDGSLHGFVDEALAERGMKRKMASVVPGFPTALSVAMVSDLVAMVPALYLLNQPMTERVHVFELPFKTRSITVSQMWHPRMEKDPAHRWLREKVLEVCRAVR
ncbi:TPA: LysR family transcriptional regulator [Enterobacter bugandensis]|uniref:LysR family transcriptional regulator n=1 Tax=Enterobacter TaxID=547 RepID=UPI000F898E07|nr:LysR family transcriptional regulator [Enterobacter bugandensis]MBE4805357.1 LysR family transcriptional regulator [Enterobacter cloacae complex sp. P43RS]EHN8826117.1 LysR family transcriptional regulator [Enterobacter bugandensis]EHN8844355.1 LysR family transcriptional regulator [Enterobacter bugandensis]MCK6700935.1 LysR family transcriptional regulator [Enterobacter bugandensis]MCK6776803.1 LysR family transcriptional regulator [Enterobacter bugandensis]